MGLTNSVQPYCMLESMTVHATIRASCTQRLVDLSARDGVMSLDPRLFRKIRHRRGHAARPVWHVHQGQSHLDAGQRSRKHQLVKTAEVADAENAARHLAKARSQGHIEAVEDQSTQRRLVIAVRQQYRGDRRTTL